MSRKYDYQKTVHYSCGHIEQTVIRAEYSRQADEHAFNIGKNDCKGCREKKEKDEAEGKAIAEKVSNMGLPELKGSPKQVAWANRIRLQKVEEMLKITSAETAASWWIDQRTLPPEMIADKLRKVRNNTNIHRSSNRA